MTSPTLSCPVVAYIGLGSNLGNPREHVERAFEDLAHVTGTNCEKHSSLYQSAPVGPPGQQDYINAVSKLTTTLPPLKLLNALQTIENAHGRVRRERWGSRTLDLDILLYNNEYISSERLTVPHPYLRERNFVLLPLFEIAPDLILPDKTPLKALIDKTSWEGLDRIE